MVQDPRNYDQSYFEIASIRIYDGGNDTRNKAAASAAIGQIGGGDSSGTDHAKASNILFVVAFAALSLSLL